MTAPEWVFGYGSLMWNPGFPYVERHPATLEGYHRAFCIYSRHHRGTPEQPGLVLGLDRGGQCRGVAFRVAASAWQGVVDYLDERELIGYAYTPVQLPVSLDDSSRVIAHSYVADTDHPQFAGPLSGADSAHLINRAVGKAGSNRDYAVKLIEEMESHGFPDEHLHELLERVVQKQPATASGN